MRVKACIPPLLGFANDITADPAAKNAFPNQFNGIWPLYAGVLMERAVVATMSVGRDLLAMREAVACNEFASLIVPLLEANAIKKRATEVVESCGRIEV